MNLREFLDQREHELIEEIDLKRAELIHLEAELAQVRRARLTIGPSREEAERLASERYEEIQRAQQEKLDRQIAAIERAFGKVAHVAPAVPSEDEIDYLADASESELARPEIIDSQEAPVIDLRTGPSGLRLSSPYASLTMKQLVVKALEEQFPHGATTRQLIDFFKNAWGREIERTNLSPQISRLYQEGKVGRIQGLKEWYLLPPERQGRRPYRVLAPVINLNEAGDLKSVTHRPGDVVWLLPDEVSGDHFQPLNERPIPDPDPDDD